MWNASYYNSKPLSTPHHFGINQYSHPLRQLVNFSQHRQSISPTQWIWMPHPNCRLFVSNPHFSRFLGAGVVFFVKLLFTKLPLEACDSVAVVVVVVVYMLTVRDYCLVAPRHGMRREGPSPRRVPCLITRPHKDARRVRWITAFHLVSRQHKPSRWLAYLLIFEEVHYFVDTLENSYCIVRGRFQWDLTTTFQSIVSQALFSLAIQLASYQPYAVSIDELQPSTKKPAWARLPCLMAWVKFNSFVKLASSCCWLPPVPTSNCDGDLRRHSMSA